MKENDKSENIPEFNPRDIVIPDDGSETKTTINIVVKNRNANVSMDFQPKLDPKNPTFDQACGAVAVQAIVKFMEEVSNGATQQKE